MCQLFTELRSDKATKLWKNRWDENTHEYSMMRLNLSEPFKDSFHPGSFRNRLHVLHFKRQINFYVFWKSQALQLLLNEVTWTCFCLSNSLANFNDLFVISKLNNDGNLFLLQQLTSGTFHKSSRMMQIEMNWRKVGCANLDHLLRDDVNLCGSRLPRDLWIIRRQSALQTCYESQVHKTWIG